MSSRPSGVSACNCCASANALFLSALVLTALSGTITGPESPVPVLAGAVYSSSITCEFVPPIPSELIPARRGISLSCCHSLVVSATRNGVLAKSICGFGAVKFALAGIILESSALVTLISDASPAAASR